MLADVHTQEQRSRNMAAIRSKDTKPEMLVRRLVHCMGYRYRLHRKDLPGKPDLTFPSLRKVLFVHGCFWHMHHCRYGRVKPATNAQFWELKRKSNVARDLRDRRRLRTMGWRSLIVWECWLRDIEGLGVKLVNFLES